MVRTTRSGERSNSSSSKTVAANTTNNSDDEDFEPGIVAPPRPRTRSAIKSTPSHGRGGATTSGRSRGRGGSRSRPRKNQEADDDEEEDSPEIGLGGSRSRPTKNRVADDDEEEDSPAKSSGGSRSRPRRNRPADDDEEEGSPAKSSGGSRSRPRRNRPADDDEEELPAKGSGGSRSRPRRNRPADEDEEDDSPAKDSGGSRSRLRKNRATDEDEEEEESVEEDSRSSRNKPRRNQAADEEEEEEYIEGGSRSSRIRLRRNRAVDQDEEENSTEKGVGGSRTRSNRSQEQQDKQNKNLHVFKKPLTPQKVCAVKLPKRKQQLNETIAQAKGATPSRKNPHASSSALTVQNQSHNSSTMSSSSRRAGAGAGLDPRGKKEIWDFLLNILEGSQHASSTGARKTAYQKLQKEFYKQTTNQELVNEHQKYFAQSLWRISLLPFKQPNSQTVARTLKFLNMVFTTMGTPEDKKEAGFTYETYPMYFYILKLFNQSHMDVRQMVRLRVVDAASQILEKHHNKPEIVNHRSILKDVLNSLSVRLRDKYAPVRVLSAASLKYFAQDIQVVKDLKYYARFDPNADVRRAAIHSLTQVASTKMYFFYEQAFDPSDIVRIEAFTALGSRHLINLSIDKRGKALYWGLTQEAKVKKCVTEKMLDPWFVQSEKNPIVFLKRLGVGEIPKIAFTVLNHIFPNDFTETFDTIDRSFLDEDNLIPVGQMSLESVIFWIFLIKKFGKLRYHADRLLPAADKMGPYIESMIDSIHKEHEKAQIEQREEDGTLPMCLVYMLTLCMTIGLEEGNRRNFEKMLRDVLLSPMLDDTALVVAATDLMKKVVEPHLYSEKMMSIFQEVFEPGDPTVTEKTPANSRSASALGRSIRSARSNRSRSKTPQAESGEPMDVDHNNPFSDREETPEPPPVRVLSEHEITQLKDKLCGLVLQRMRMGDLKRKAIDASNFLEAHRLQEMIEAVSKEEQEIRVKIQTPQNSYVSVQASGGSRSRSLPSASADNNSSSVDREGLAVGRRSIAPNASGLENTAGRSRMDERNDTERDENPLSQANTTATEDQVAISEQNMLKGLVMLTRFLSLHPKLTPFVRELYQNHIILCLTEEDARIRMYTLQLLCMIGLIDDDEKRKIMALMLRALDADDDPLVKSAAFKGCVDLLLKYSFEEFRRTRDGEEFFSDMPVAFNDPGATHNQLEELFILKLDKFASPQYGPVTPTAVGEKVLGMIKLLQISRIVSESIISELLCMWSDKQYNASAVPFNIGIWLPTYTKIALSNGRLVGKALLMSVKRILNAQDDNENTLCDADYTKLVDFVVPYISSFHLNTRDGENVHEELVVMIFNDILNNPKWTGNSSLVKVTSKLRITKEETAKNALEIISNILLKIAAFPQTATIHTLKTSLKSAGKRLNKQFEGLGDLADPERIKSDDSDIDSRQPGAFSDSDDDISVVSGNLPVAPQVVAAKIETIDEEDENEGTLQHAPNRNRSEQNVEDNEYQDDQAMLKDSPQSRDPSPMSVDGVEEDSN